MTFTKVKNVAYQSLKNYPTLYLRETLEDSILEVYNHLFFVLGNGYDWLVSSKGLYYLQESVGESVVDENGEYVEYLLLPTVDYDENEPEVSEFDLKALHESLWQDYLEGKPPFETGRMLRELILKLKASGSSCSIIEDLAEKKRGVHLYPVSESSFRIGFKGPMFEINQLAPDWKDALLQLTEYAIKNLDQFDKPQYAQIYRERLSPKELVVKINNVLKNGGSLND